MFLIIQRTDYYQFKKYSSSHVNDNLILFSLSIGEMGCSEEITTILAMLQVQNVFTLPGGGQAALKARVMRRKFEAEEGDLVTLLNVYTAYETQKTTSWCHQNFLNHKTLRRATEIRTQMRQMLKKLRIPLISCNGKKSFETVRKFKQIEEQNLIQFYSSNNRRRRENPKVHHCRPFPQCSLPALFRCIQDSPRE